MRILLLLFWVELALPLFGGELPFKQAGNDAPAAAADAAKPAGTNGLAHGPNDGLIASTTAEMLEKYHYLHPKFDTNVSGKFLDLYLNTLDPQHIHFLKSDIDEFEKYRSTLGDLTREHDTTPAYLIFDRFLQREAERVEYSSELLKGDPFDFTGDDQLLLNRKTAPYPADIDEARAVWRQRVRFDYLLEKLNKQSREEIARTMLSRRDPFALALAWRDAHNDFVKTLTTRYHRTLRIYRDWGREDGKVLETYLTALAHVFDPHSDYFDKADLENFSIQMSLSLSGVGAELTSEDGYCKIVRLLPAGPADKSGELKPNDRIVAVAQGTNEPEDVVDLPLPQVVEKIRGTKNTEVRLTVIPAAAVDSSTRKVVKLTRDEIKLEDQEAKASIIELPSGNGETVRLGVIDLPSFYASYPLAGSRRLAGDGSPGELKSTTVDVARLLIKLKKEKVSGVILDLRLNGGGFLEEAINLTGLFIKDGPVVQIKGSGDSAVEVRDDRDPSILYDGPLVVLTSRLTASASEILAGALQDYGRALVVGDKSTHGKGTVQSMSQLAPYVFLNSGFVPNDATSLGALKYTTNKFYRVSGSSTQLKGVIPDLILPSVYDYMELGEASLENPLPWDTIDSATYQKLNRVQPYLDELRKRSAARVAADKDFAYVREDGEQVKKAMGDKPVTLNEAKRLKENEENEVRRKAREDEIKLRKWPDEKIYPITLSMVDQPGLPPALVRTDLADNTNLTATGTVVLITTNGVPVADASGTNAVASNGTAAPAKPKSGSLLDPADQSPEDRGELEEAEHIMVDYISLLHSDPALAAHSQPSH